MKQSKITLAPAEEVIHFLAVFQRAFRAIHEAAAKNDREGMLLGAHVADALHNVPSRLLRHDPTGSAWEDNRPDIFPRLVQQNAPERIAVLCAHIFSSRHDAEELGLESDLGSLDFAPPPQMDAYLTILYRACLGMRLMRNYGNWPSFWADVDEKWTEKADEHGVFNAELAELLLVLPAGLTQWRRFNEKAFWQDAGRLWRRLPYRYHTRWEMYFDRKRWWWLCLLPLAGQPWACCQLSRGLFRNSSKGD